MRVSEFGEKRFTTEGTENTEEVTEEEEQILFCSVTSSVFSVPSVVNLFGRRT